MLNEERVKHMVKLAAYEGKDGEEEIKISMYEGRDYVRVNVIASVLWMSLGYLLLLTLLGIVYAKVLVEYATAVGILLAIGILSVLYVVLLIRYIAFANRFYREKHKKARQNVKRFVRDLDILEDLYEKEEA
ncbi:MAG: hypothetical protein UHS49_00270 [Faecalimonas sp.]|nr:hypothetical protein [Faecalimonas sp.]